MAPQSGQPRSASQVRRSLVKHHQPPDTADVAYQAFVYKNRQEHRCRLWGSRAEGQMS